MSEWGWGMIVAMMPRVIIFAISIFVFNIGGSILQMCYSPFTIVGTCTNPQYMPLHYSMTGLGFMFGCFGMFVYNFWATDSSDDGDAIE